MNSTTDNELELLKASKFCEEFEREIPDGYYGLYLANPKNRWKRNQFNHALADRLLNTHNLTFTNVKMIRYGEFYIFKVDEKMESWGLNKLQEFCITHPGVHYSVNIWPGELFFDKPSPNSMDSIRKEEEERVAKLNKANGVVTTPTFTPTPEQPIQAAESNMFKKINYPKVKAKFSDLKTALLTKLFGE